MYKYKKIDSCIPGIDESAPSLTWGDESDRMSEQRTLNGDCKGGSAESGQFSVSHPGYFMLLQFYH